MLQIREAATQLYLLDLMDTAPDTDTCTECGEDFEVYEHNPYTLCRDCVDTLQALADLRSSSIVDDGQKGSYEAELMALPGTRRGTALRGYRGAPQVNDA